MHLELLIRKIKNLEIQGAKEIAIESLKFLKSFSKKNGFGKQFDIVCKRLNNTRPTAVVLHNCLEIIRKNKNIETIDKLLEFLSSDKISNHGIKIIKKKSVIMTHCHSSEALSLIKKIKTKKVFVTETEPREQGIKTAKELAKEKISTTLIIDSAKGFFMPEADCVIIGADALRKEGVVNKIGSYPLSVLAKEHGKQFFVVADTLKIDRRKKFEIEERPAREVYKKIKGVKIRNPAFDITPWKFVTSVITEKGVFKPEKILEMIK